MSENAKITSTFLGKEDHGIFTCYINLKGDGWGVSLGGYALDGWVDDLGKRVATNKGLELIAEILHVVGVDSWEKLTGRYIRIEGYGLGKRITKFGNLIEDNWLDFETFFDEEEAEDE